MPLRHPPTAAETEAPDDLGELLTNIGTQLRHFRYVREWSGSRLAREAGVNQGQLNKYERGKRAMGMSTLVALAGALEIAPWMLLVPLDQIYVDMEFDVRQLKKKQS